jgi:Xaa-Pro dipeptidase
VKTPEAIERIRAAIEVAEDALAAAVDALRPGVREVELKGAFAQRMCELGTTTPAFEGMFCVIDGDAPVRRFVSDRVIADGDLVAMSAGVLLNGWEGSLARTWPCGAPTAAHRDRRARWRAQWGPLVERCRAGARVGDLRMAAGASLHALGLGYEGLEDDAVLEPGMVVELELETAGILGADTLLVDGDRPDRLTAFPYGPAAE